MKFIGLVLGFDLLSLLVYLDMFYFDFGIVSVDSESFSNSDNVHISFTIQNVICMSVGDIYAATLTD